MSGFRDLFCDTVAGPPNRTGGSIGRLGGAGAARDGLLGHRGLQPCDPFPRGNQLDLFGRLARPAGIDVANASREPH